MATTTVKKEVLPVIPEVKSGGFRRYMLMRSHPAALFLDATALIWVTYFLWYHAWQICLLILVVQRTFTWFLIQSVDTDALAKTLLGKLALLHLNPFNAVVQLLGVLVTGFGVWMHETVPILSGISLILVGHTWGWRHVHQALDCRLGKKP